MEGKVFDFVSGKELPKRPPIPDPPKKRTSYTPYDTERERLPFVHLYDENTGINSMLPYSYMTNVKLREKETVLDLHFGGRGFVAVIIGKGLRAVMQPVQRHHLSVVSAFCSLSHLKPKTDDEPFVKKIFTYSYEDYWKLRNGKPKDKQLLNREAVTKSGLVTPT